MLRDDIPIDGARGAYRAYGTLAKGSFGEVCDVRRWMEATDQAAGVEFQYRFLMQVGYVGDEMLKLYLPDSIIVIEGQRLREVREKLARRVLDFIQQYHPKIWPMPADDAPIIERIEIARPGKFQAG